MTAHTNRRPDRAHDRVPVPGALRARLAALIVARGHDHTARLLGCSAHTLADAIGPGAMLRRVTLERLMRAVKEEQ